MTRELLWRHGVANSRAHPARDLLSQEHGRAQATLVRALVVVVVAVAVSGGSCSLTFDCTTAAALRGTRRAPKQQRRDVVQRQHEYLDHLGKSSGRSVGRLVRRPASQSVGQHTHDGFSGTMPDTLHSCSRKTSPGLVRLS